MKVEGFLGFRGNTGEQNGKENGKSDEHSIMKWFIGMGCGELGRRYNQVISHSLLKLCFWICFARCLHRTEYPKDTLRVQVLDIQMPPKAKKSNPKP